MTYVLDAVPANSGNWSGGSASLVRAKAPASSSGLSTERRAAELRRDARRAAIAVPTTPVGSANVVRAIGAEVVLVEVVGQQQAVAEEVLGDDAVLVGRTVEPVVDAADRSAEQAEVAGGLAGVDQLAALVEVVAHRHRQVLLALGDRQVLAVGPNRYVSVISSSGSWVRRLSPSSQTTAS